MIPRLKRQTKKRHSVVWPERTPRIRLRHNMTEVVWWEAPASVFFESGPILMLYEATIGAPLTPDVWAP